MSLDSNIQDLATRVAQELNAIRDEIKEDFLETTIPTTQQLGAGNTYQDVAPFETPDASLNTLIGISFNETTGEATCTIPGVYRFYFETTLDQYDGNNRSTAKVRLVLNGSLVKGTEKFNYHRQNLHGFSSYNIYKTVSLTLNDVVKVQASNQETTRDHQLLAESTLLRITKIKV